MLGVVVGDFNPAFPGPTGCTTYNPGLVFQGGEVISCQLSPFLGPPLPLGFDSHCLITGVLQ